MPHGCGALLFLIGRVIALPTPRCIATAERLARRARAEAERPVAGELERAAAILDLTLQAVGSEPFAVERLP